MYETYNTVATVQQSGSEALGVMILSLVEMQETQDSQSNPEKEQQTACQDLSYLTSVQARRAFPPVLPVKQCCPATSAARTAVEPHVKNEVGVSIYIIQMCSGSHPLI